MDNGKRDKDAALQQSGRAATVSEAQFPKGGASASGIIRLTERDLVAAQRLHFRSGLMSGQVWRRLAAIWGIAALAFALFVALVSGPSRIGPTLPVFALVVPVVVVIVFLGVYALAIPRNARRAHAQQKSLSTPYTYTIADDALILTGAAGAARLPWRDIHRVRENDSLFLVYEWDELYRPLPKRCLSDDHLQALRQRTRARPGTAEGKKADDFDQLDTLVKAYLNQDLHEFYETVEDAIADCVRHSDETRNRRLQRQMDAFEARYRDDMEAAFAQRYGFDFEPRQIGQTVPQFFDMVRAIVMASRTV